MIQVGLFKLKRRNNAFVARLLAESLSTPLQDRRAVCFGKEEEKRPRGACEDGADPERPVPG